MERGIEPIVVNIIMIGEHSVGKSSLFKRFNKDQFESKTFSTIGTELQVKDLKIGDDLVRARIWDTAGQERYRVISNSFYRQADGIILVFDLTDSASFQRLDKWIKQIEDQASEEIAKSLVGNKCDLLGEREVSQIEGIAMSKKANMIYMESSAKDNINVSELFFANISAAVQLKKSKGVDSAVFISPYQSFSKKKRKSKCCQHLQELEYTTQNQVIKAKHSVQFGNNSAS